MSTDLQRGPPTNAVAAMVVRNEQDGIVAAISSLRGVVTQVVVLDTGSTDKTLDLVRDLAANAAADPDLPTIRVEHETWRDDFAWARNRAAEFTPEDTAWLVVLDGDEVLEPGDLASVMAVADDEVDAVGVKVTSAGDAGQETHWSFRAYRRGRCTWRYPVHNQLVGIRRSVPSTAVVRTSYKGKVSERLARSVPMLLALHASAPTDPHAPYYLAKSAMAARNWSEALRWCRTCESLCPDDTGYATFWLWYARATLATQGLGPARSLIDRALDHHPGYCDLWHEAMTLDTLAWARTAAKPGPYLLCSATSTALLAQPERLHDGLEGLGIPVASEPRQRGPSRDPMSGG